MIFRTSSPSHIFRYKFNTCRSVCFSFKGKSANFWDTNASTNQFVPSPSYSAPASSCRCSHFPPAFVGRAARPRAPTPPANAMLKASAFAKARRSWGRFADFAARGKIAALRGRGRGGCAPRPEGCGARLGARGRAATPPTAHPLGRVTRRTQCGGCGLPTNAGG